TFNLANSHWWQAAQNFTNASTSEFTATSSVFFTGVTASRLLGVDNNGMVIATTSIGTNLLAANGVTAGSCTNCNLTIAANGIVTAQSSGSGGSSAWPFTPSTYAGVANQSTTTPLYLNGTGIIASSTLF